MHENEKFLEYKNRTFHIIFSTVPADAVTLKAKKQFPLLYRMGEDIGCRAVMLRSIGSQCIGVCISTGLHSISKYTL
jgi:hypothetical protein